MTSNDPPVQFGKLPYAVIETGILGRLKRNDLAVYIVLAAYMNTDSWTARPSIPRIALLGGMCGRTVQRVINRLERIGLIRVFRHRGRSNRNEYLMTRDPSVVCDAAKTTLRQTTRCDGAQQYPKHDNRNDAFSGSGKDDNNEPKTRQRRDQTATSPTDKGDTKVDAQTERQIDNTRNRSPGAFAKESGKKKLRQIEVRELSNTGLLMVLFDDSVRRGLISNSDSDRLSFVAAAEHALRKGKAPCKLFASIVNNGNWHHATQADEDAANRRLKLYLHGESAPPPRETPAPLDLAWQGPA